MPNPTRDVLTPLLSVDAVSDVLSVSPDTVRRMLKRGELRRVQVGKLVRIHPGDVAAYIERATSRPT